MLCLQSWGVENDKMREKLLSLIGKIGSNAKVAKTTTKVFSQPDIPVVIESI